MDRHRQVGEGYNIGARGERTNLHVVERICGLLDEFAPAPQVRTATDQRSEHAHRARLAKTPELYGAPRADFIPVRLSS